MTTTAKSTTAAPDTWADLTAVLLRHHPELGQEKAAEVAWSIAWGVWAEQDRAAASAAA